MINDLLIEPDSLRLHDAGEVSVGVRMPWYRAVPLSCIVDATPLAGHTLITPQIETAARLGLRRPALDHAPPTPWGACSR